MKKNWIAGVLLLTATAAAAQVTPLRPMADGVMTRDEAVAAARAMFTRVDANRDGFVTQEESAAMRAMRGEKMGQRGMRGRSASPEARFDRLDTNRDNMISREEFARADAMRAERMSARGERMGRRGMGGMADRGGGAMIRLADTDRDNRVSLQEATNVALQRFDRADANRDGRLTREERPARRMR